MSTFIEKADYGMSIQDNILDDITELDDTKLDKAEKVAISLVKGYLNSRYLVDEIFNQTGDDRNEVIVQTVIDLALYDVHARINPRKIPALRKERRDNAIQWLKEVQNCTINPPDLPRPETTEKNYILYGSNPKRANHI